MSTSSREATLRAEIASAKWHKNDSLNHIAEVEMQLPDRSGGTSLTTYRLVAVLDTRGKWKGFVNPVPKNSRAHPKLPDSHASLDDVKTALVEYCVAMDKQLLAS